MRDGGFPRAIANVAGSLFVTALTIAAIFACSKYVFPIPSPSPILLIAVVFSAFAGGLPAGLLSAVLVVVFGAILLSDPRSTQFTKDIATARIITLAVAAPTLAILVGLLKRRTQHSAAQAVHRQSEQRFREALINAPVPVMMHTEDGEILLISNEWARLSGYAPGDIPRLQDWLEAAHGAMAGQIASRVKRLFDLPNGAPEEEFHIRTKSGEERIWSATVSAPGTLGDGRRYLVVIARDITQAKLTSDALAAQARVLEVAKEQAEAANRAKDQFLAALSHELRTPLAPVLLTAAALENDAELSERLRSDVALIRRNVEMEARLIDDLLDLTRVARGKLKLDLRPLDPVRVMRAALEVCEDELQTKGLQLTLHSPPEPLCVNADAARLQQVFWNLIKNAVKFTPAGGRVQIRCEAADGRFHASVVDTGIGIELEMLPRIFDAFEQGGANHGRQFGGLGLGLAICKALVQMHGGTLTVASDGRDRGASFNVALPLSSVPAAETSGKLSPGSFPRRALRILLVEDHDPTCRVLAILLRQMNHQVTAAPTVAAALKHAEQSRFDLLISDLGLPDGTGADLMQRIRQKYSIAGICLSGYGMDQAIIESRQAGFIEHLIKPVDLPRLKSAIENVTA